MLTYYINLNRSLGRKKKTINIRKNDNSGHGKRIFPETKVLHKRYTFYPSGTLTFLSMNDERKVNANINNYIQ